jgi:mono/diheme cytochrome c family protein
MLHRTRTRYLSAVAILTCSAAALAGCRGAPSEETPIVPIRNMYDQPRYDVQGPGPFFEDGRAMRPVPEGTIPREAHPDTAAATGWSDAEQSWALTVPRTVVQQNGGMEAHIARGQDRYEIYCTPCHGYAGDGDGMVPTRVGGAIKPPTFHDDRLRHAPDGQIFATITHGIRNMPMYRHSIPANDRWAIVSYVRALQLNQQPEATAMNLEGGR